MSQLTNEMIIESFSENQPSLKLVIIMVVGIFLIFGSKFFINYRKEQNFTSKKSTTVSLIIALLICGVIFRNAIFEYNAIQYSIEHNCFDVVTDTVVRTNFTIDDKGHQTYYVYLNNNGKICVSKSTYNKLYKGNSVYIVIANGRFGGRYLTSQIYPTSGYEYVEQ